jgi:HD-GYP domain-containing protein (c-di-GMP phosphodiesterase class II)
MRYLEKELPIILFHHERYDGKGYPDKLAGEKIPLGARIVAIADAYEAMTNPRPYHTVLDDSSALQEIKKNRGKQFDPALADAFIKMMQGF